MNRIGRRTIMCMLLIAALAVTWKMTAEPSRQQRATSAALGGTLVTMVPFNQGLIVAADSRFTIYGGTSVITCDNVDKIVEVTTPRTLAAVTGLTIGVTMDRSVPSADICERRKAAPRFFDIDAIVKQWLESSDAPVRNRNLGALADLCLREVQKAKTTNPAFLAQFRGTELFHVAIASYDPQSHISVIRSIRADIKPGATVEIKLGVDATISTDDSAGWFAFGEYDYLMQQVLGAAGKAFYNPRVADEIKGHPTSQVSREQAIALAHHLIDAASKTTGVVAPPSGGIGGPIKLFAIGSDPMPERVP